MAMLTCFGALLVVVGSVQSCCPPPQLEGITVAGGVTVTKTKFFNETNDPYSGYSKIYHDEVNRKFAKDVYVTFEKAGSMTLFVLEDYAGGKRYVVLNGTCSVAPLKGDFNRELCVSPTNYKGKMVLGLGNNTILMDLYSVNYSNPDFDITGDAMVFPLTEDRCVPQSEMIIARKGSVFVARESAILYNTTDSISNSSIFDIPNECQNKTQLKFVPHFHVQLNAFKIRI
ncbi:uncharacterized protein LOC133204529 [Saccostrea echinata]|uniref:uncharacterized protein LOC133204529 n=1 Tax=Saccostrea echinata TaxID=191078 RepID=UPI002A80862B|nr:uncharacterized protein LOC133204529 [Saccostrea echinata]